MTTGQLGAEWVVQCDIPGCENEIAGVDLEDALSNAACLGWTFEEGNDKHHACSDCNRGTSAPMVQLKATLEAAAMAQAVQQQMAGRVKAKQVTRDEFADEPDGVSLVNDDSDPEFDDEDDSDDDAPAWEVEHAKERAAAKEQFKQQIAYKPFDERSGATIPGVVSAVQRPKPTIDPRIDRLAIEEVDDLLSSTTWDPTAKRGKHGNF